jgi:AraC-like DNA-binding protein
VSNHHPNDRNTKASSRVDIWRPREFDAVELHRGFNVTLGYPRHWHDEIYLCTTLDGTSQLECGGANFSVPRGTLVVVPPGEVHANEKVGCDFRCIFLGPGELQRGVEQYIERNVPGLDFRTELVGTTKTAASFLKLHRLLEDPVSELTQDHSLFAFFHEFAAEHGTAKVSLPCEGNEDAAVRRVRSFLQEHYARPVRLKDLARLTGVSPYRLNRSFCRKVGMPPHAFQLQVRLARAKTFLEQGRSAAETASLAGFFDQSHFTHAFKRSEGITPRQYLRCCKNLQDGKTHTEYFGAPS